MQSNDRSLPSRLREKWRKLFRQTNRIIALALCVVLLASFLLVSAFSSTDNIPNTGYIRRFRLAELLGVSVSTIDRKVRNGSLPRPVKLGEKITAFDAVEINNWLAERRGKVA